MTYSIEWLLDRSYPAARFLVLTGLLDLPDSHPEVVAARAEIPQDPWIAALFTGQQPDGSFAWPDGSPIHPYTKWMGAHWRLVSLVELGLAPGEPRALAAAKTELDWLVGNDHRSRILSIEGRTRRCASQEGNALAACCRLGLATDSRLQLLAESLIAWQWPDGGWNCDKHPQASHSSFHESLIPMWGLFEYFRATGNREALAAALRTADFFLRHKLFRSERSGEVIHPEMLELHYPPYWHYDILQALLILARMDLVTDSRAAEALDVIQSRCRSDGTWRAGRHYWLSPGNEQYQDPVDWGRRGPNRMITLNALRVLKAAGRVKIIRIGDEYGFTTNPN